MTISRILTFLTILVLFAATAVSQDKGKGKGPAGPGMTLTTTAFPDGGEIPAKYTQSVSDPVSPKLEWTHVPAGTVSFALIMHDPDVARNKTTTDMLHWLIFNIAGSARSLPEGVAPGTSGPDGSLQAKNGGEVNGYRGPGAPAAGPHHHYTFELYALDTKLDLGSDTTRPDILKAMEGHVLGKAVLEARFHR